MQILGYILFGIMAVFGIAAFIYASEQNKQLRKQEKQFKAEEKKVNEITTEANKTKADARTGDHERDFNYMADKLHEFANQ